MLRIAREKKRKELLDNNKEDIKGENTVEDGSDGHKTANDSEVVHITDGTNADKPAEGLLFFRLSQRGVY